MSQSTAKPDISIVIVTWNGKKYALECLDSLRALNSALRMEVIVVDNASTDGTPDAIQENYPEVRLIRNEANLGFAKANNIGLSVVKGDFLCLVNSDVVVPPGCLEKMIDYMRAHTDIGLLGPKMLSPTGGVGQSVNRLPTVWNYLCFALGLHVLVPNSRLFGGYLMAGYPYNKTEDVEVLTGWFWMVPRAALEQVGGLDERFFMYGEDLDWSYRFLKAGWRVVFFAEAEALHYGAASSGQAPTRFYVEMVRANLQYFRKHYGWLGGLGFVLATAIHDALRVVVHSLMYCVSRYRRPESALAVSRSLSCLRWITSEPLLSSERVGK
ncbi:MAG TPA: glycosyltransferase family 2 protein [Terriglobales bacterium]|nr:glycosyltransferase family 2 protein [Terriglobales bacterium]